MMEQLEYYELDFDGSVTIIYYHNEAGYYIDNQNKHASHGVVLARLGREGW
jgi:hypothetical protein